jgi:tRNA pseudouridine55 synthase
MATRLLRFVEKTDKRYAGEIVLGVETSTLDAAGDVTATHDMTNVTVDDARRVAVAHLTGAIMQVPPMVSAIKVGGRRLHELARAGIEIEREPRPVTIHSFEVDAGPEPGVLAIDVVCSAGTYVRTLAADLERLLGGGAHPQLRRTAVGEFAIVTAAPPDSCTLLPVATAVRWCGGRRPTSPPRLPTAGCSRFGGPGRGRCSNGRCGGTRRTARGQALRRASHRTRPVASGACWS